MSLEAIVWATRVRDLKAGERLVLIYLANHAGEEWTCFPSHRKLAEQIETSTRTVLTHLAALEAAGHISREERRRPNGSRTVDLITLHGENFSLGPPRGKKVHSPPENSREDGAKLSPPEPSKEPSKITEDGLTTVKARESDAVVPLVLKPRSCRLPEPWAPTGDNWDGAVAMLGDEQRVEMVLDVFRDYWRSAPGEKGRKLDWDATWRNWVRREAERNGTGTRVSGRRVERDRAQADMLAGLMEAARGKR